MKRIYTKELLIEAVKNSLNFAQVCRYLNVPVKGGSYELIRNRVKEYNLNIDHFLGYNTTSGKRNPNYQNRVKSEDILINGYLYRAKHSLLKKALLEQDVEYKCSCCNIIEWNNKPITLDIDHIDGDWSNCKKENLRFLCPNCHRQTDNFGSKNLRNNKVL